MQLEFRHHLDGIHIGEFGELKATFKRPVNLRAVSSAVKAHGLEHEGDGSNITIMHPDHSLFIELHLEEGKHELEIAHHPELNDPEYTELAENALAAATDGKKGEAAQLIRIRDARGRELSEKRVTVEERQKIVDFFNTLFAKHK